MRLDGDRPRSRARAGHGRTGRWPKLDAGQSRPRSDRGDASRRSRKRQGGRDCRRRHRRSGDPPRRRGQHPGDDADPHLPRARASRRRARSARPDAARAAGRPDARISRLHRRRARPEDLARRRAGLRAGLDPPDPAGAAGAITAARSASNICTSTTWRSAASSRTGSRARTPRSSFTPEGKQSILAKVIQGEQWEKFLARKYVGTKRFGLDGGEIADSRRWKR